MKKGALILTVSLVLVSAAAVWASTTGLGAPRTYHPKANSIREESIRGGALVHSLGVGATGDHDYMVGGGPMSFGMGY